MYIHIFFTSRWMGPHQPMWPASSPKHWLIDQPCPAYKKRGIISEGSALLSSRTCFSTTRSRTLSLIFQLILEKWNNLPFLPWSLACLGLRCVKTNMFHLITTCMSPIIGLFDRFRFAYNNSMYYRCCYYFIIFHS